MAKQYTLDDGSIVTALEVSNKVGITITNARTRLSIHTDPLKVFKPKQIHNRTGAESYKVKSIKGKQASIYNDMFRLMLKTI